MFTCFPIVISDISTLHHSPTYLDYTTLLSFKPLEYSVYIWSPTHHQTHQLNPHYISCNLILNAEFGVTSTGERSIMYTKFSRPSPREATHIYIKKSIGKS